MMNGFEEIHNYNERNVVDEVIRRSLDYPQLTAENLADVACVALNRLPARYVRHDVDLIFYLTSEERRLLAEALETAVTEAYEFVASRAHLARDVQWHTPPDPSTVQEA